MVNHRVMNHGMGNHGMGNHGMGNHGMGNHGSMMSQMVRDRVVGHNMVRQRVMGSNMRMVNCVSQARMMMTMVHHVGGDVGSRG